MIVRRRAWTDNVARAWQDHFRWSGLQPRKPYTGDTSHAPHDTPNRPRMSCVVLTTDEPSGPLGSGMSAPTMMQHGGGRECRIQPCQTGGASPGGRTVSFARGHAYGTGGQVRALLDDGEITDRFSELHGDVENEFWAEAQLHENARQGRVVISLACRAGIGLFSSLGVEPRREFSVWRMVRSTTLFSPVFSRRQGRPTGRPSYMQKSITFPMVTRDGSTLGKYY